MNDPRAAGGRPPEQDSPLLAEIVRRLVDVYRPERVYLFGSTARQEAGPDSDIDRMAVVPDSTPPSQRNSGRACTAIWRLGAAANVLVWIRGDFDGRLHLRASLPAAILREGRLLYAA